MSKLTRVFQNIFGSTAPSTQIGVFGSLAAGAASTSTDPAAVQALSNFKDGWFAAIMGSNSPAIEDMNSVFFLAFRQLAYLFQAGVPEYDASTTYFIGSIVNSAGSLYMCLVDGTIGIALTDATKWQVLAAANNLTQQTANYTALSTDSAIEMDATSGSLTVTLPAASSMPKRKLTITKMDASPNSVTVGSFSQLLVTQYDSMTIYSNGSVWYQV